MDSSKMRPERTLFYDVDTQRDFLLPRGARYVPGSERILPVLRRLPGLPRRQYTRRIGSTDRHFPSGRELARNGGPWPDHCMDGTSGQRKVDETAATDPRPLPAHEISAAELESALNHRGELIIEKQDVDVVAGNANARALFARLARDYDQVVIYGVYTDVCVDHAVNALLEPGRIPYVVIDAIHEIDPANAAAARDRWSHLGVRTITCGELEEFLDS